MSGYDFTLTGAGLSGIRLTGHANALRFAEGANSYLSLTALNSPSTEYEWILISMWIYRHSDDSFNNIIDMFGSIKVHLTTAAFNVTITTDEGALSFSIPDSSHDWATDVGSYMHVSVLYDQTNTGDTVTVTRNGVDLAPTSSASREGTLAAVSGNGLFIANRADNPTDANNADIDLYMPQVFAGLDATSGNITPADVYNAGTPIDLSDNALCILAPDPDDSVVSDSVHGVDYTNNNTVVTTTNIPS